MLCLIARECSSGLTFKCSKVLSSTSIQQEKVLYSARRNASKNSKSLKKRKENIDTLKSSLITEESTTDYGTETDVVDNGSEIQLSGHLSKNVKKFNSISIVRIRKNIDPLYIATTEVAKQIMSVIIDDLSKNMCSIAEVNPGFGLLTRELLNANVGNIHLYEDVEAFRKSLSPLLTQYPDRLTLNNFNLFKLSKYMFLDLAFHRDTVETALRNVARKNWADDCCMHIIGALIDIKFIRHQIMSVVFQNALMMYGRPAYYLMIPPTMWQILGCDNHEGAINCTSVMFQTMFDYKLLSTLDRNAFLPEYGKQKLTKSKNIIVTKHMEDKKYLYLVKIEPKRNLLTDIIGEDDLVPFWYFVRHNLNGSKKRVIPELEKLLPGCGVRLIQKDYNIFTEFRELSAEDLLNLFKEFRSWPEYKNTVFTQAVDSLLMEIDKSYFICEGNNESVHLSRIFGKRNK